MKIRHILHSFRPLTHGGVETYVASIAAGQMESGDDVSIVTGREHADRDRGSDEEVIDGVPVRRLPHPANPKECGYDRATSTRIRDLLAGDPPDVLHVHHWHNLSNDVVAIARELGIPVVLSLHDYFATCPLFNRVLGDVDACPSFLERAVCIACCARATGHGIETVTPAIEERERRFALELASAGRVLALSHASREYLQGVRQLRGIDVFAEPLPRPRLPERGPDPGVRERSVELDVVSWGGLVPGKGFHVLLEAAAAIGDPARLRIRHFGRILDADYRERIERSAPAANASVHGVFDYPSMFAEVARADLAVFPSFFMETHGYVVDEAMMLGLPVVVSDRGAPKERIGGRGRTFPAGDVRALERLLREFLDDPAALKAMRAAQPNPSPSVAEHVLLLRAHYVAAGARAS